MTLSDRITQLNAAVAACNGDAGADALRAIDAEHGQAVTDVIMRDLLAAAVDESTTQGHVGPRPGFRK